MDRFGSPDFQLWHGESRQNHEGDARKAGADRHCCGQADDAKAGDGSGDRQDDERDPVSDAHKIGQGQSLMRVQDAGKESHPQPESGRGPLLTEPSTNDEDLSS